MSNGVQYESTMRLLRRCRRFATATCNLRHATCYLAILLYLRICLMTTVTAVFGFDYHDYNAIKRSFGSVERGLFIF